MDIKRLYKTTVLEHEAKKMNPIFKKTVRTIKSKKPKKLDNYVHNLHNKLFKKIDCLDCGNCCKSLGPMITDRDIEKLSKHLKIKGSKFIEQYLIIDEDKDYVFKSMPCPFLDTDNTCFVYDHRPKACSDYPHTNHPRMIKKMDLALNNAATCPAVFYILSELSLVNHNNIK